MILVIASVLLIVGVTFVLRRYDIRVTPKDIARREQEARLNAVHATHSRKLESLGRLSAGVAHDFNNVLGVILTHVRLAENAADQYEKYHVPGHDQIKHDLKIINQAADQAAEFVKQLLIFSRQEGSNPRRTVVREVVQQIDSLLRGHLDPKIDFVTNWNQDEDPWPVFVDPDKLSQVLLNLALNANDAMPEGGTLQVTMRKIVHDGVTELNGAMPTGRYVKISVEDDGVGIGDEHIDHIFEPFYTSKPQGTGSGLGLATVYGIVTQAGGYINVTSKPTRGTRFDLYFPVVS